MRDDPPAGRSTRPVVEEAASAGGHALAVVFGTVARLRRGRPLHPQGATYTATVTITGAGSTGVGWLDDAGSHDVTVRVSRAAGLPLWMPDVYGIAVRVAGLGTGTVDLLFASTGDSPAGRFVLRPGRGVETGPLTTLLPVRSERGALLLRLVAAGAGPVEELSLPAALVLSAAHGTGPWHDVGTLVVGENLEAAAGDGETQRHDPVVNQLPGTEQYAVVERLREPAYRAARRVGAARARTPSHRATGFARPARRRRA